MKTKSGKIDSLKKTKLTINSRISHQKHKDYEPRLITKLANFNLQEIKNLRQSTFAFEMIFTATGWSLSSPFLPLAEHV